MSRLYSEDRLENTEIRDLLVKDGNNQEQIDDIIQQFWFRDWHNSLISFPSFFELLQKYLKEQKPIRFKRPDFYSYIFAKILKKDQYPIVRKLAVAYELQHTDKLRLKEYTQLVKKLKYSGFYYSEFLKDNPLVSIQKDKDTNEKFVVWAHHTLTEYLASDYILEDSNPIDCAEKLAIYKEGNFVAVKPSWYGAIRFLLESDKVNDFSNWLAQIGQKYPDNIDDDYSQILLTADPELLSGEIKSSIFNLIYDNYKNKVLWLPVFVRNFIGGYINSNQLEQLKRDINDQNNEIKTFVYKGNVVAIITSLLERKSPLLGSTDKEFWKKKFVRFANDKNDNGVLQRHSLDALALYKDKSLIPKVSSTFNHRDQLVKEAFVQFCYETDPDTKVTIDYMVEAIKRGIVIYARFGLYEISSNPGLLRLLKHFENDKKFLEIFIDKETIFDSNKDRGDFILIDKFRKLVGSGKDKRALQSIENILLNAFSDRDAFHLEHSHFIQELGKIARDYDSNFLIKFVNDIKIIENDQDRSFSYYLKENLFPYLLTKNNLKEFLYILNDLPVARAKEDAPYFVYSAKRLLGCYGEELYKFAVSNKFIAKQKPIKEEDRPAFLRNDPNKIYEGFVGRLDKAPKRFLTDLFEYYINNREIIDLKITPNERKILITTIKLILSKDTNNFKVKLLSKGDSSKFNWTSTAAIFGDAIRVAQILIPKDIENYRKNIINFIPFCFSTDQSTITDTIKTVDEQELSWVYKNYTEKGDLRYFLPDAFIQIVGTFRENGSNLHKAGPIMLSIAQDVQIKDHDRANALEKYKLFINSADKKAKETLNNFFSKNKSENNMDKQLAEIANSILIEVFKDRTAIKWRFDQLVKRKFKYNIESGFRVHEVGANEEELDGMSFAKPLLLLRDEKYQSDFISLLDSSMEILNLDKKGYWSYVNYLWRIVISYFDGLKNSKSIAPYLFVQKWAQNNLKGDESNWFYGRLSNLRTEYVNSLGMKSINNI